MMAIIPRARFIAIVAVFLLVVGCKLEITVPEGGSVVSRSGSYECLSGKVCTIDIYDLFFNEEFIAQPEPGYSFLVWRKAERHLCSKKTTSCKIVSARAQIHENFMQLLESDKVFYLEPLFLEEGRDGIRNEFSPPRTDAYAWEAINRHATIIDPHLWDIACPLFSYLTDTDHFLAITKMTWWGFYMSGNLPAGVNSLNFIIRFYEDSWDNIVNTAIVTASVKPATFIEDKLSTPVPGHTVYEYETTFDPPLQVLNADIVYSIVQADNETGQSDPNFKWHARTGGRNAWFNTGYGGWIRGSTASCIGEFRGYHSSGYPRPD